MRTRKNILFVVLIVFVCSVVSAKYPSPVGHVNDFAKILPQDVKERIEAKLSDYEKQTSIQIVVVTTKTLGGKSIEDWTIELAEEWEVGQKGKDNGVVFAVAPNEREMRIEVGYGLEWILTDGRCGRIRDKYARPYFRKGNYAKGIENTVDAIINELGIMSPAERAEERAKAEAERKKAEEEAARSVRSFMLVVLIISFVIAILVAVGIVTREIWHAYSERQRKKQLRKQMRETLAEGKELIDSLSNRIKAAEASSKSFPDWALKLAEQNIASAKSNIESTRSLLLVFQATIDGDVDKSGSYLDAIQENLDEAVSELKQVEKDIPTQIESYRKEAPTQVAKAKKEIVDTRREVNNALSRGFRLNNLIEDLDSFGTTVTGLGKKLDEQNPNFRNIFDSAEKISNKTLLIKTQAKNIVAMKMQNEGSIEELLEEVSDIKRESAAHEKILSQIRQTSPEANWQDISNAFVRLPTILSAAGTLISSAKIKNSMEKQDFSGASEDIEQAKAKIGGTRKTLKNIVDRDAEIKEAKKSYETVLQGAETSVRQASEKVKNSDVGTGAKNKAQEAKQKLNEAKQTVQAGGLVDWLFVALLITSAVTFADEAKTKAQSDIDDAEERREEAARKKAEAERKRQEESSYSYSSYHTSDSSHSVFHGGGGHFGGGGASGGW